jgi:ubiquinone/menaquinone biosynthesis C-methylase UbiE
MDQAEFDKFADEYRELHAGNIAMSGESPEYFAEYKVRDLVHSYYALHGYVGAPYVLDFGAGVGTSVQFMRRYLPKARLTCVDVSSKSLEIGRARFGEEAEFISFDGSRLPFPDGSFDVAFAACVFHHIDHREHVRLLSELRRVLVADGVALVYEHNPYNPLTRHVVNTCTFDENAHLITARSMRGRFVEAGFAHPYIRYRVFFPSVVRGLRRLESWITWLPFGAQYYVAASK